MKMIELAKQAKQASFALSQLGNFQKNQALLTIADNLQQRTIDILSANAKDIEFAQSQGISEAILICKKSYKPNRLHDFLMIDYAYFCFANHCSIWSISGC